MYPNIAVESGNKGQMCQSWKVTGLDLSWIKYKKIIPFSEGCLGETNKNVRKCRTLFSATFSLHVIIYKKTHTKTHSSHELTFKRFLLSPTKPYIINIPYLFLFF